MIRLWSAVCVYVVYIVGKGAFDVFGQACCPTSPRFPLFHLSSDRSCLRADLEFQSCLCVFSRQKPKFLFGFQRSHLSCLLPHMTISSSPHQIHFCKICFGVSDFFWRLRLFLAQKKFDQIQPCPPPSPHQKRPNMNTSIGPIILDYRPLNRRSSCCEIKDDQ